MDKIKINLFGESWSLKELQLKNIPLSKFLFHANALKRNLNELLLELSFYEVLNIPEIKSIEDLPGIGIKGLKNTSRSQLEIWINDKKKLKIYLSALLSQNTIFELYRTEVIELNFEELSEGLYLFEYEIGLISSYYFISPRFTIDQLKFVFLRFRKQGSTIEILSKIIFNNKILESSHTDSSITYSNCNLKYSNLSNLTLESLNI